MVPSYQVRVDGAEALEPRNSQGQRCDHLMSQGRTEQCLRWAASVASRQIISLSPPTRSSDLKASQQCGAFPLGGCPSPLHADTADLQGRRRPGLRLETFAGMNRQPSACAYCHQAKGAGWALGRWRAPRRAATPAPGRSAPERIWDARPRRPAARRAGKRQGNASGGRERADLGDPDSTATGEGDGIRGGPPLTGKPREPTTADRTDEPVMSAEHLADIGR